MDRTTSPVVTTSPTLAAAAFERFGVDARRAPALLAAVFAGSWLIALSAQMAVPFWPVPITMQTFAVLLVGAALGWKAGAAAVVMYLAQGAMGLPFFAGGVAGAQALVGPTAGYLYGFVVGAAIVGWLAERGWGRSFVRICAAMALGNVAILLMGATYLGTVFPSEFTWNAALLRFLPGAVLKTLLAAALLPVAWKALEATGAKG